MANLNIHMTHLEDTVFLLGIKDTRQSIDFLRGLRDMLKGHSDKAVNTSVKWDGAPALFIGKHPETGKFLVAKKSLFNKKPLFYTSVDEIKLILKQYEELEMYLECAGIYNALEVYKFNLSVDLAKIMSEDKIKNNIKFIKDDKQNKKGS